MKTPLLVLCGHGSWLQMATALVARHLQPFGYQCLAIELPADNPEPASLACGPELETVCQMLGIPLTVLLQQAAASFSLGYRYQTINSNWFVPYGCYGTAADNSGFTQALPALLRQQPGFSVDAFSVAALAANQGKFGLAPSNKPSLQAALQYGLHLDNSKLADCLRHYNQQLGVGLVGTAQLQLHCDDSGYVHYLQLADGQRLHPDYLLDCRPDTAAGAAGTISMLTGSQALTQPTEPFSSAIQTDWGWLVKHPLQHHCHWYTEVATDSQALTQIQRQLASLTGVQQWQAWQKPRTQLDIPWQQNQLRWGHAASGLESPLSDGLAALQYLVVRWLDLITGPRHSSATATLYNQHWQHYQAEVQQFLQLLQQPHASTVGQVFARLGHLPQTETDAIKPSQWLGLLSGLGLTPQLPAMTLTNKCNDTVQLNLQQISQQLERLVAGMPSYQETLSRCLQSLPE